MKTRKLPPDQPGAGRQQTEEVPAVDRYTVLGEIGRGGLGRVSHATDSAFDRQVAIKQPLVHTHDNLARFEREAKLTASLQHSGVVPVYDIGRWFDGAPYFVMKKVEGHSLEHAIAAATSLPARLALLPRVLAVTDAIAYAHGQRVIHRDLKPANVIISDYGETVVIDWGLAKRLQNPDEDGPSWEASGVGSGQAGMTREGTVMGTPQFMSPEQAEGRAVDERSDVYALGALLYNVLSGEGPFSRETPTGALARVRLGSPPSLRQRGSRLPPDLIAIVEKAMAREPGDRYASARELAEDLRRFLDGQLVAAQRYSGPMLLARWVRQHRAAAILLAASIVIAVVGVASVIQQRNAAVTARNESEARQNALVLLHAERSLVDEPTSSAAWLKSHEPSGMEPWRANAISF
jgi:serine/threonine protein kinase